MGRGVTEIAIMGGSNSERRLHLLSFLFLLPVCCKGVSELCLMVPAVLKEFRDSGADRLGLRYVS